MKKIAPIVLATLLVITLSGPAAAGPDAWVNVGTAQISHSDLDQLRAMVAGRPPAATVALPAEPQADLGVVELARKDLDQVRAMVAGTYRAPAGTAFAARQETVDVGKVALSRSEYESLKRQVAGHLQEVRALIAQAERR